MNGRAVLMGLAFTMSMLVFAGVGWGEPLQKQGLSLADAKQVAAAAAVEAKKNKWAVSIAIVDDGGHLIYLERIDEAFFASVDIAVGKARTAVAFKRPTKALEDAINAGQHAILTFPNSVPREGGLPILMDGKVVGAVGVSGGTAAQDAQIAKAGTDALMMKK